MKNFLSKLLDKSRALANAYSEAPNIIALKVRDKELEVVFTSLGFCDSESDKRIGNLEVVNPIVFKNALLKYVIENGLTLDEGFVEQNQHYPPFNNIGDFNDSANWSYTDKTKPLHYTYSTQTFKISGFEESEHVESFFENEFQSDLFGDSGEILHLLEVVPSGLSRNEKISWLSSEYAFDGSGLPCGLDSKTTKEIGNLFTQFVQRDIKLFENLKEIQSKANFPLTYDYICLYLSQRMVERERLECFQTMRTTLELLDELDMRYVLETFVEYYNHKAQHPACNDISFGSWERWSLTDGSYSSIVRDVEQSQKIKEIDDLLENIVDKVTKTYHLLPKDKQKEMHGAIQKALSQFKS